MRITKLEFYEWCHDKYSTIICGSITVAVLLYGIATLLAVYTQSGKPYWFLGSLIIVFVLDVIIGIGKLSWSEHLRQKAIQRDRDTETRRIKHRS